MNAYNVHTFCILLSVYHTGYMQVVFWSNRSGMHISLYSFLDRISKKSIWLEAQTHLVHTFWGVHAHHVQTIFGCMHTFFRDWKPHLLDRVLQAPSGLLLVWMVLFHPPPFWIEPPKFYFRWSCRVWKLESLHSLHGLHVVCTGLPPDALYLEYIH